MLVFENTNPEILILILPRQVLWHLLASGFLDRNRSRVTALGNPGDY